MTRPRPAGGIVPKWPGVIEAYRHRLPVDDQTPALTLLEGNTPLLPAPVVSEQARCETYLKVEGANPTGSFKDRGMALAVAKAVQAGSRAIICASTGNTAASAAAYAARAGLRCAVVIPAGNIAVGKLAQALVHGAQVVQSSGSFDDCLVLTRALADEFPVSLVNSVNIDRLHGQKTAAFEIVTALGDAPHIHCLPVGNAGNIAAYWLGYGEEFDAGQASRRPRMLGFQASGAAPIVTGQVVAEPRTLATAIRIGNPASWAKAIEARDASHGAIRAVTDEQIVAAYRLLAQREGVFVEPASAASVAGLLSASQAGLVPHGSIVVCTLTGHGLKDPDRALAVAPPPASIVTDVKAAAAALDLR